MFFVMVSQDGLIARYKPKKHALVYLWSNSVWVEISQQERMLGAQRVCTNQSHQSKADQFTTSRRHVLSGQARMSLRMICL